MELDTCLWPVKNRYYKSKVAGIIVCWEVVWMHNRYRHSQLVSIPVWITLMRGYRKTSQFVVQPLLIRKIINYLRYGWKVI